jgi:hypothetical protein
MSDTDISVTDTLYQGFLLGGPRTDILMGILSQRVDEKESTARRLVHTSRSSCFVAGVSHGICRSNPMFWSTDGQPRIQLGRGFPIGPYRDFPRASPSDGNYVSIGRGSVHLPSGSSSSAPHNAERQKRLCGAPHKISHNHCGPSGSFDTGRQSIG